MSGNQPSDDGPPEDAAFPAVGQYVEVPGPGDAGYVEPPPDLAEGLNQDEFAEPVPDAIDDGDGPDLIGFGDDAEDGPETELFDDEDDEPEQGEDVDVEDRNG